MLLVPMLNVVAAAGRNPSGTREVAARFVRFVTSEPDPVQVEAKRSFGEAIATALGLRYPVREAALQLADAPRVTERDEAEAVAKGLFEARADQTPKGIFGRCERGGGALEL